MSKLLLIDGHSILNRAYYGLPDLTNSKGQHTNAVYGFLNMMFKYIDSEKPDHFAVAFDVSAPTFRHEMYKEYKGTRHPMDPELKEQVPMIQEMLTAMGVPIVKQAGLEADDILGTLSVQAEKAGYEVTIVSGDRDLLQLATDHVKISIPKTKKTGTEIEDYYAKDVLETKGVTPTEFIDVKALWGDTADNIPGVPSIGEKTATAIIQSYQTVENAYAHIDEIKPPRAQKNLREYYDQAILSKKLATINTEADVNLSLKEAELGDLYTEKAFELCREWDFKNLLPRFSVGSKEEEKLESEIEAMESLEDFKKVLNYLSSLSKGNDGDAEAGPERDSEKQAAENPKENSRKNVIGLHFLIWEKRIRIFALSDGKKTWVGIPEAGTELGMIVAEGWKGIAGLSQDLLLKSIEELRQKGCMFSMADVKEYLSLFPETASSHVKDHSLNYQSFYDDGVAAYLLDPLQSAYPMDEIAKNFLDLTIPSMEETLGKTKMAKAMDPSDDSLTEDLLKLTALSALAAARAPKALDQKLSEVGAGDLYRKIELPLVFTLSDMEKLGMEMDRDALIAYGTVLQKEMESLEASIYEEAGEKFNINSPKQLSNILFEKMAIPGGKKTKTGYSTAADVLERLAPWNPIVQHILDYRKYSKLKSTYVDGLSECLGPDGRVHSTFQQKVTATGRISSTNPNLQNIPVRMELGKKIRKVFHPAPGYIYLDADYSQIELRVLAHLSGDKNLIQAYLNGQDIHRSTASLVFHTPFDEVTDLQRRNAKAVNFGIVYGISAFGLSQDLHISQKEAKEYIDNYYAAYPDLKIYLDGLVQSAREKGYAETLFGRRRPIPELKSSNFMQRQFGERVAMNSPVQGTAADIIKIAMVRVHDRLAKEGLSSRLVLQVHDELLIEAKKEELETVKTILKEEMMGAAHLAVPLEIDMEVGEDWFSVH